MIRFLLTAAFSLSIVASYAQAPNNGGPTPGNIDPTDVPLDGGASLLLAGGVAYGLRRISQRRRKQVGG